MISTRVAIAQFESSAKVEVNRAKMSSLVEKSAAEGADLIVFHELATTNYFCYDDEQAEHFALAEPVPGPSTDALADAARRSGVSVLLPLYEADGDARFNTVAYIDAQKGLVGKYRKTHIPVLGELSGQKGANEGFYFSVGDTGLVVPDPVAGLSVGSMICYDRHFPEGGRSYALQGAHLIFVPTASYRESIMRDIWHAELQTLAFQNCIYVVGVNKVGPVLGDGVPAGSRYPGGSVVFSPEGQMLAECGDSEELIYADIDPQFCEQVRSGPLNFFNARRPDMYTSITAGGTTT